jgi:hypothetical protein
VTVTKIASIFALSALSACAVMFPFNYTEVSPGPTRVGPDWTTFTFKPPMEATYRRKGVLLELPADAKWTDIHEGVFTTQGKSIKLTAEVITVDGKVYQLPFVSPMGPTGYKELYVVLLSEQIPQPIVLSNVRIKATEPFTFGRVLWLNSTPH